MTYEDFCTTEEVAVFKRVKKRQMTIAHLAREVVCEWVEDARLHEGGKEFIETPQGLFRMAMNSHSDNETERREHLRLGARTVNMSSRSQMFNFWSDHDFDRPDLAQRGFEVELLLRVALIA